ncbi:MAG TPA: helix-turn-helix transcriptional regulator [Thermomicrobiales bacterium]|nr:helix-turn-helix transcriptional regulator [Thermomicrobiales bacterium]
MSIAEEMAGRRIAPVLARWRRELGWTQDDLAARSGVSRGYLSRLERGVPEQPGLQTLSRICGAMGRTWADLYAESGLGLPGDVTLADIASGLADPELGLYLRRLPELDERDRLALKAVLRAFLDEERGPVARPRVTNVGWQLALPATEPDGAEKLQE